MMHLRRSLVIVSITWLLGVSPIAAVLVLQTVTGKYGSKTVDAWAWFLAVAGPTSGVIIGAWISELRGRKIAGSASRILSWITIIASGGYILAVLAPFFAAPLVVGAGASDGTGETTLSILNRMTIGLAPAQGLLDGLLSTLFYRRADTVVPPDTPDTTGTA